MCTFNKNNRKCIHLLKQNKKFIDFTEEEDYYLCNDELNIAGIETDDLVKFRLLNDDNITVQRVYGFIKHIYNVGHTTFMICEHYSEQDEKFYLDYVYSSFHHAFKRLNHHGSFSDWNQLTHTKQAHAPEWFVNEWLDKHVRTEELDDEFEDIDEQDCQDEQDIQDEQNILSLSDTDVSFENLTGAQIDILYDFSKKCEELKHKYSKDSELVKMIDTLYPKLAFILNKIMDWTNVTNDKIANLQNQYDEMSNRLDIVGKVAAQASVETGFHNQCYHHTMC